MSYSQRKSPLSYYFRMFLGIGYLVVGIIFLTTNISERLLTDDAGEPLKSSKMLGIAFGVLCLVYGAFRMYRAVKNWDTPSHEQ